MSEAKEALRLGALSEALALLSKNSLVEVMEGLETLLVYAKNLIQYPEEKKYRKVKKSNVHYQQRLGHLCGAEQAMSAIGYVPNGEYLRSDDDRSKSEVNINLLQAMEKVLLGRLNEVKDAFSALPHRLDDAHDFVAVKGASVHSEIGKRHSMEDDDIIIDCFANDEKQAYFGLYDGHGGRATVDFVVKVLHMNLEHKMKTHPHKSYAALHTESYLATDGQLRRQNILRSGSTSVTCVVKRGQAGNWLYTANVGDSRAVLIRGTKAQRLTLDHKASLPEEAKRITEAGGWIGRNKRVNGVLAISRALGDHMLKENDVVSASPFTSETKLNEDDTHLLLACDGVWDVLTDQEAVDLVMEHITRATEAYVKKEGKALSGTAYNAVLNSSARALVKEALDRRSLDNITVMMVAL